MSQTLHAVSSRYVAMLKMHVAKPCEATLAQAYEIGRMAVGAEICVLDMAIMHHQALSRLLATCATKSQQKQVARAAGAFFSESLSAYEIMLRGFRERNQYLLSANEALHQSEERLSAEKIQLAAARDQAESATRSKSQFLANMSHEVRTPMNAILGFAYLLDQNPLDPDSAELVKKIRAAGRSLQIIINDILDLSKIEAGQLEIEHAPFRLADVFDNLASIMSGNVGDKDIEMALNPPPEGIGYLMGDALRVQQVLINLTGNAIKFTEHGSVVVGVEQLDRNEQHVTLRFSVTDTGLGIASDKQEQIFSAFSQADVSTTRRFGGTGLGLTICRHLVSKMGGEIGVVSQPGKGSEFWFTLPFECGQAENLAVPQMAHLDILVVDDSAIVRESVAATAKSLGWRATVAASGEAAIEHLLAQADDRPRYHVLLLDWKMPGLDGLATATHIRHKLGEHTPAIILMVGGAQGRQELMQRAEVQLADALLGKPVTGSCLYNAVAQARAHCHQNGDAPALTAPRRGPRCSGARILLADDSELNREVGERILSGEGAIVYQAENGQAAYDWLQANPDTVDLVLMDVQMPLMDGYEATRLIRALPQFTRLPIVALTAGAFQNQQDAATAAGMNAFVAKPFDVDVLVDVIRRLTGVRQAAVQQAPEVAPVADDYAGIDMKRGLLVWQDLPSFQRILAKFVEDHADCPGQLSACYTRNDQAAALALAHKVKGVAANLALTDIARILAELEQATAEPAKREQALARLQTAFATALATIAQLPAMDTASTAGDECAKTADGDVLQLLQRLLGYCDQDDYDAVQAMRSELTGVLAQDGVAAVYVCIDDFNFREAEVAVRKLIDTYQAQSQGAAR